MYHLCKKIMGIILCITFVMTIIYAVKYLPYIKPMITAAETTESTVDTTHTMPTQPTVYTERQVFIDKNSDILFIGNSLTEGIRLSTGSNNKFICEVGVSLDGLKLSSMYDMDFKVVVINMGTNELGVYSEEYFKKSYTKLIQTIQEYNPEARIICCSIPPIIQQGCYAEQYNNVNSKIYTEYVKTVAKSCNVEFLDNAVFFGEELSPDWTGDGLHLHGNIYKSWYEFLLEQI